MGNSYSNVTLKGPEQAEVVEHLRGVGPRAWVSPTAGGWTVVFDGNAHGPTELGPRLSLAFGCPALRVMVHGDDVLYYQLCQDGRTVDEYDSWPEGAGPRACPSGGNAHLLCRAFGAAGAEGLVEAILRKSRPEWGTTLGEITSQITSIVEARMSGTAATPPSLGYLFEIDRHADLVRALGLPRCAVGAGYRYIRRDGPPDGLDPAAWAHVGDRGAGSGRVGSSPYAGTQGISHRGRTTVTGEGATGPVLRPRAFGPARQHGVGVSNPWHPKDSQRAPQEDGKVRMDDDKTARTAALPGQFPGESS